MKRRMFEILVAAMMGIIIAKNPAKEAEAPAVEAEREIIDLPWEFAPIEEEPELTQYNIELIARVCMSEAGQEPFIGKVAVAMTVLNRCDRWGKTTEQIVYTPNAYSTQNNGIPNEECYAAVAFAIENRGLFPADMMYFRNGHYHKFAFPYVIIGNHYFSTETDRRGENNGFTL